MKLTTPSKMIATALTIAVVAVPAASAADIPAGQPAPGGDGRIATVGTNDSQIPAGFDFRVSSQQLVSSWPEGQPAPGGTGIDMDNRSTFPEGQPAPGGTGLNIDGRSTFPAGQPAPGGTGRVDTPVSYWPEGQPAPGGDGHVTTPNATPIGFDFKAPADWVTATDGSPTPISVPAPGGFDFTDTVIGASAALAAALMALLAILALRRRGGLVHS
jgi:hypothetical protein